MGARRSMWPIAMIAGAVIYALGVGTGLVLDHFTTWTGPKPSSWQILAVLLIAFFTAMIAVTFLIEWLEDRDGPEEEA